MRAIDSTSLQEFIENQGVSFKKNSVSFIFDCPRCSKRDKLYIRRRDGRFVCWYCREISRFYGAAEYALSEILRMPIALVRQGIYGNDGLLSNDTGIDLQIGDFVGDYVGDDDEVELEVNEVPEVAWPLDYYPIDHEMAKEGLKYLLEQRGVPPELAIEYQLRYHPKEHRVVFPIVHNSKLVGWQGRLVRPHTFWDDEKARYVTAQKIMSSRGIPRDKVVMFGDRITSDYVVVSEGPLDAIHCHLVGGNVATMGKAVSRGQIDLIRSKGVKKVYLALDPDALLEVSRLLEAFSDLQCYSLFAPKGYKDLGEMPLNAVVELFRNARKINKATFFGLFRG